MLTARSVMQRTQFATMLQGLTHTQAAGGVAAARWICGNASAALFALMRRSGWSRRSAPTLPSWSRCSARCAACSATMAAFFLILGTLTPVLSVQALMAQAAKHLKVRQVMVVFAEVYVMRVAWLIGLADFAAVTRAFPCLFLPTLRPSPSIWQHRSAIFPGRA